MSLVRLHDVSKSFGNVRAVDGVSFSIGRGEVVGFLGPNGAGKTTTMRLITQALEPDAGWIEVEGMSVAEAPIEARRRIGYLPERNPLFGDMLVAEFLEYMGSLRALSGRDLRTRIDRAVEQTGIGDMFYRPIDHLSKGYRQRTGLAQAILSEPDVLVLDEPTEGLDPSQRVEIRKLITHLGADRTVLLSTHVMQEVQATCGRLLIIKDGRLIADGTVDSLLAGKAGVRVRVELEAGSGEARAALEGLSSVERVAPVPESGDRPCFVVAGAAGQDPRPDIFALARDRNWTVWELRREREDLEQIFRDLTEAGA
ncbi:MAG: ABC transporter ATP-binding protein [Gemmatimonadota bacterium]|nr:ABC transporter ATP-binding protein [Gemmatimonadota bacterium]MDH3428075.1 ABC transporter ATP-binding protein [Gemmatimonadota bacterium]